MPHDEQLVCGCGAELNRPMPVRCPSCGVVLSRVRVHWWSYLMPLLIVGALFTLLIGYLYWMSGG